MSTFSWVCPYCQHAATISNANYASATHKFDMANKHGHLAFTSIVIVCPNSACREYTLRAFLRTYEYNPDGPDIYGTPSPEWQLRPNSSAKPMPDYIPAQIVADYNEACLIRDLSPKASATLARRCLQGMIRDFHKVKPDSLFKEVNAIKDNTDPVTWAGIDAVRKVGNIGAHMEADVDVIIDVGPDEAQLLIGLIETLMKDWYITRHERQESMNALIKLAADKDAAKKAGKNSDP